MSADLPAGFTLDAAPQMSAGQLPPGFTLDADIPPTQEGFGQMVAGARQPKAPPIAPPQPVAGLPVPGYPGQFSQGAQPPRPAPQATADTPIITDPMTGAIISGPETNDPNAAPGMPAALSHIGNAIGSAFAGPYGPSDASMGTLVNGPSPTLNMLNRAIVGGGGAVLDAASRPLVGAARGIGAMASEGAQALGMDQGMAARLERDIGQLPDSMGSLAMSRGMPGAREVEAPRVDPMRAAADRHTAILENDVQGPARGGYLLNQLTDLIRKTDEPPVEVPRNALMPPAEAPAVVQPGMGTPARTTPVEASARAAAPEPAAPAAPAPNSVGAAATPSELTNMTPREAAVQQARAENLRLSEPAKQGVDRTEYVPGVRPTAAEVAGDARVSGEQKYISQTPGQQQKFAEQLRANNEARLDHYDNLAGDAVTVERLRETRGEQAQKDLQAAWGSKAAADAAPVVETIDQALAGPTGKLSAVSDALTKVRKLLYDSDGKLETDPEVLYGARREVSAMLGKAAQQERPTLKDAARELQDVKDHLDAVIEAGAPGYKQYLRNYSEASRPIDVHELLQDARPSLTNGATRDMSFAKVDSLMRKIVADRQKSGTNPAKSIDEATMEGLWNLHSDLKRLNNLGLGKPAGSDTSSMQRMGGALGLTAAHGIAGAVMPFGIGNMLVQQGSTALANAKINRRVNQLLDGASYKP